MNTILEQINSAGSRFVEFALPMFVQSGVLILILLLADFALHKKVRAVFRYWIWMLVLLKLILPTSLSTPVSLGYLFGDEIASVNINHPATETKIPEPAPAIVPPNIDLTNIRTDKFTPTPAPTIPATRPVVTEPAQPPAELVTPLSWQGAVFILWAAVVLTMGLLLLQRAIFVRGLVAQAKEVDDSMADTLKSCRECIRVKRTIGLRVSTNAASPAVCGLFRPVILVPKNLASSLNKSQLRAVLLHELAHIRRGDLWVNLAQTVLQIVYFYNPLLWLANTIIRRTREQAVDEMVLVAMGEKAQQYPQTLVDVAKLAFKRPALSLRLIGVVESKSALAGRIKHILNRPMPKRAKLGILGLLLVIIIAAILLPMAACKPGPPSLVIKGIVKDAQTGEPIAGARVFDDGYGPEPNWEQIKADVRSEGGAITNSAGEYSFLAWPEHHSIKVEAPVYKSERKSLYDGHFIPKTKDTETFNFFLEPEKVSDSSEFKKTLPNGVTVELIGVCEHPSEGKQWWRPNGAILESDYAPSDYSRMTVKPDETEQARELALRFAGQNVEHMSFRWKMDMATRSSSHPFYVTEKREKLKPLRNIVFKLPRNLETLDFSIGIATGEWEGVASGGDGRTVSGTNDSLTDSSVIFQKAAKEKDTVRLCATHLLGGDYDCRIVVVDGDDEIHEPIRSSNSGSDMRLCEGFFDLSPGQIEYILLQARPYEWVEFKNVSLRPGYKTDVKVGVPIVEDVNPTPTRPGIISTPILGYDVKLNFAAPTIRDGSFHSKQSVAFVMSFHGIEDLKPGVLLSGLLIGQRKFSLILEDNRIKIQDGSTGREVDSESWFAEQVQFNKVIILPVKYGQKEYSCPIHVEMDRHGEGVLTGSYRFCAYLSGRLPWGAGGRSFEIVNLDQQMEFRLQGDGTDKRDAVLGIDIDGDGKINPAERGGEQFNLYEPFQIGSKTYRVTEVDPYLPRVVFNEIIPTQPLLPGHKTDVQVEVEGAKSEIPQLVKNSIGTARRYFSRVGVQRTRDTELVKTLREDTELFDEPVGFLVKDYDDGVLHCIDFDNNRIVRIPDELDINGKDSILKWSKEHNIDALFRKASSLVSLNMASTIIAEPEWSELSTRTLVILNKRIPGSTDILYSASGEYHYYAFKTSQGRIGVLGLASLENNGLDHRLLSIKYKLLKPDVQVEVKGEVPKSALPPAMVGTWFFDNPGGDDEQMAIFPDGRVVVLYSNGHRDETHIIDGFIELAEYEGTKYKIAVEENGTLLRHFDAGGSLMISSRWSRIDSQPHTELLRPLTGPDSSKSDEQVKVEPVVGEWEDIGTAIPADFNDTISLAEHITLGSIGQDVEGKTFITLLRDREITRDQQYRFILVRRNGTVLEPASYDSFLFGDKLGERFSFDMPYHHRQIKEFRLQRFPQSLGRKASLPLVKPYDPDVNGKIAARATSAPPGRGALHFDGQNDYLYVPDSRSLSMRAPFTVEMWIKPEFPKEELENWPSWGLISKGCYIGTGRVKTRGFGITLNRFKDDPSLLMVDYCTADENGIYSKPYGRRDFDDWIHLYHVFSHDHYEPGHGNPLVVGKFIIPESLFAGQIGEIRIWAADRSRDQISEFRNKPLTGDETGLVACWTFEQSGGQIAYDISTNRNHARLGTTTNADEADPTWVNVTDSSTIDKEPGNETVNQVLARSTVGPVGQYALSFDGVDDYLHVAANPTLTLKPPFTIEMWLKPDFSELPNEKVSEKLWPFLSLLNKGKRLFSQEKRLQAGGFMMFVGPPRSSSSPQPDWKCSAGLYLGNEKGLMYQVDGFYGDRLQPAQPDWLYVSTSCTRETYIPVPDQPLLIGQNIVPIGFPFKGQIAEIRIWAGISSCDQIAQYSNKPLNGNEPGLVACWDFKRPEGQIVYDISPNANHARLGGSEGPDDADPKWIDIKTTSDLPGQKTNMQVKDTTIALVSSGEAVDSSELTGRVVDENGNTVADAQVAISTEKIGALVSDGKLQPIRSDVESRIVQTDSQGIFDFGQMPTEDFDLIVAHEKGFSLVESKEFVESGEIHLQPWGRIEGQLAEDRKAAGNKIWMSSLPNLTWLKHKREYRYEIKCDESGHFVFDKVPPGWFEVGYLTRMGENSWSLTSRTPVVVKTGQTAKMRLGGEGRPVTGRFVPPQGYDMPIYFGNGLRSLATQRPERPRPDNYDRMTKRQQQQWYKEWYKTDEYRKFGDASWHNKNWRQYTFSINKDGSFRIEDVIAGKYQFTVWIEERHTGQGRPEEIAGYYGTIEVPEIPGGRSDEPLDLGDLELTMHNPLRLGDIAPLFEAKTLDGKDLKLIDYRGKFVLLSFWQPVFHPELQQLRELYDTYVSDGQLEIIGLVGNDTLEEVKNYVEENAIPWPQIYTGEEFKSGIAKDYGGFGIFLIDPDGRIIAKDLRGDKLMSVVSEAIEVASRDKTDVQAEIENHLFSVYGTVTDQSGRPIAGVQLTADCGHEKLERTGRAVTDENGRYTLGFTSLVKVLHVDPYDVGIQTARIEARAQGFYEASLCRQGNLAMAGKPPSPDEQRFVAEYAGVVLPHKPYELNFVMHPAARIEGKFVDERGRSILRRSVWLSGDGLLKNTSLSGLSYGNGTFTIDHVPCGTVWFTSINRQLVQSGAVNLATPGTYRVQLQFGESPSGRPTLRIAEFQAPEPSLAESARPRVIDPNGNPVASAQVALCTSNKGVVIRAGKLSPNRMGDRTTTILETDADGSFDFSDRPDDFHLIVAHEKGFAWITREQFTSSPEIRLQSWGRIEGHLYIGRKSAADKKMSLLNYINKNAIDQGVRYEYETDTDAGGKFVFDKVPPGWLEIGYLTRMGNSSWSQTGRTPVQINPGVTLRVAVGGRGRPVVGKFVPPPGYDRPVYFGEGLRALDTLRPERPKPENYDRMTKRQRQQWYNQWSKTPEAGAYYDAMWHDPGRRHYVFHIKKDGSFRIEDVIAGKYQLTVWIEERLTGQGRPEEIAGYYGTIEVPEMPGGRSDEPLDLGELELTMHNPLQVGDIAPSFEAKTLDGKDLKLIDYRGKFVLLSFWQPVFHPEKQQLQELYDTYGGNRQLEIIGLGGNDTLDEVKNYVEENAIPWPQIYTGEEFKSGIAKDYGIPGIPEIFLIGPDGRIIAKDLRDEKLKSVVTETLEAANKNKTDVQIEVEER